MDVKGNRGPAIQNPYLTHCKFCPKSVLRGQNIVWLQGPIYGAVHKECYVLYGEYPIAAFNNRKYVPSGV